MKLYTEICDLLGIKYPIISAGMGPVSGGELAAAVSEAGGLGLIGTFGCSYEELFREIKLARERTNKPIGVGLVFPPEVKEGLQMPDEKTLMAITGGRPLTEATMNLLRYFSGGFEKMLEVVLEEKVPIIVSGLGNPTDFIPQPRPYNLVIAALVGNCRQARALEAAGVELIIAQGYDAGGHTGNIGTFVLIPQVVDTVRVPVLAAGGICDGRGIVAALALGARGVLIGTRFTATPQSRAHIKFKEELIRAIDSSTVRTKSFSGKSMRCLRNRWTEEWERKDSEVLPFPLQAAKSDVMRGFLDGDMEYGCAPAGQVSAMVKKIMSAGAIVQELVKEAENILTAGVI
jgi:enoyl-[acyl-carrier protein] reductase II